MTDVGRDGVQWGRLGHIGVIALGEVGLHHSELVVVSFTWGDIGVSKVLCGRRQ